MQLSLIFILPIFESKKVREAQASTTKQFSGHQRNAIRKLFFELLFNAARFLLARPEEQSNARESWSGKIIYNSRCNVVHFVDCSLLCSRS